MLFNPQGIAERGEGSGGPVLHSTALCIVNLYLGKRPPPRQLVDCDLVAFPAALHQYGLLHRVPGRAESGLEHIWSLVSGPSNKLSGTGELRRESSPAQLGKYWMQHWPIGRGREMVRS